MDQPKTTEATPHERLWLAENAERVLEALHLATNAVINPWSAVNAAQDALTRIERAAPRQGGDE